MEVLEAIKSRRSIRKYKDTPIDESTLQQVLEAAQWAPSWANTQCWRFIVVSDTGIRTQLTETLSSNNPATDAILNAPLVIVACAQKKRSGHYHGEPSTDKGDGWLMFDTGLAMQNLVLAAHALGLGTVHVGAFDARMAEGILDVTEEYCVVEMVPLGYPDQEARTPPRKELSEIVFYEKFPTA